MVPGRRARTGKKQEGQGKGQADVLNYGAHPVFSKSDLTFNPGAAVTNLMLSVRETDEGQAELPMMFVFLTILSIRGCLMN